MSVKEGLETDKVRDVAAALLDVADQIEGVRGSGAAMLRLLAGVWEGGDVALFTRGWDSAGPRLSEAADGLRDAGKELERQVDDQIKTSGGEGGGGGWGWPDLDLPDLSFPDLGNPLDGFDWDLKSFAWPDIDWGGLWDGFLDVLESIGDWWDDLPLWAQILIGIVAAVVIVVVAILAGLEIIGALAIVGAIAAVAGIVMTILDSLDAVAEFLRDPEAAIRKFLDDPLSVLDDLIWLGIGFLPFGIGKFLGRFRKPISEFLERAVPGIKRKADEIADFFRRKKDELAAKVNDWEKDLRRKYSLGGKELKDPPPAAYTDKQLQTKYKHAEDFGVDGNYNKGNAQKFREAVDNHIADPATKHIDGTYQGKPAILDYNPNTGLVTVRSPSGDFISGWKASPAQARNIETRGSL